MSAKKTAKKKTVKRAAAASKKSPKRAAKKAAAAKAPPKKVARKKTATPAAKKAAKAKSKKASTEPKRQRRAAPEKPSLRLTRPKRNAATPLVTEEDLSVKGRVSSGLNKRDLARFRELLLRKRAEIVGDMSTLQNEAFKADGRSEMSSMPIHMADLGTDNYEQEFTLRLLQDENGVLREINQALKRIEGGTYGICEATGRAIGKARLEAQPWARFCYEYTLLQEQRRGRF